MVRDTVRKIERGVRSKSKHYDQDERSERASTEKADHSEQANQTPSQLTCAWCARCVFFCARRGSSRNLSGATRARSRQNSKKRNPGGKPGSLTLGDRISAGSLIPTPKSSLKCFSASLVLGINRKSGLEKITPRAQKPSATLTQHRARRI